MKVELAEEFYNTETAREAAVLMQPCVQCGQCTFTCPTFRLLDDEWDGPRGRIYLIKQFLEGSEPSTASLPPAYTLKTLGEKNIASNLQLHLDRCLSCRSCETSCPQGVRYGRLLDISRELVGHKARRSLREKILRDAVRLIIPFRRRVSILLRAAQAIRGLLPVDLRARIPLRHKAGGWPNNPHSRSMLVWQGCVQPVLAPDINAATARVLDHFKIRLIPASDGCCGALTHHMGETEKARTLIRKSIDDLWPHIEAGVEAIVLTASGCGMHFRDYGQIMQGDPLYGERARRISDMTIDIAEVITRELGDEKDTDFKKPPTPQRVAFQASCSLQHGENLNGVVEKLLKRSGFKLVPVSYPFMCCGAAGTYSILQRKLSELLRARKLVTLLASRPEVIATANIGCLAHLETVSPVPVRHWIELLDEVLARR